MLHRYDPVRYPQPRALSQANLMGETQLLVAGGVWNQPAGAYLAARRVAYLVSLLDAESKSTADAPVHDLLNDEQLKDLLKLKELRMRITSDNA